MSLPVVVVSQHFASNTFWYFVIPGSAAGLISLVFNMLQKYFGLPKIVDMHFINEGVEVTFVNNSNNPKILKRDAVLRGCDLNSSARHNYEWHLSEKKDAVIAPYDVKTVLFRPEKAGQQDCIALCKYISVRTRFYGKWLGSNTRLFFCNDYDCRPMLDSFVLRLKWIVGNLCYKYKFLRNIAGHLEDSEVSSLKTRAEK